LETTDWRLWGTLAVGVVSLLWNFGNTIYTFRSAKRIRGQAIRLDEFKKSIRDPIVSAMDACEAVGSRAEAISASARQFGELTSDIESLNREAIAAINTLSDKLNDADNSRFSKSSTWLEGYDQFEEKVLGCFNEACNPVNSEVKRREALIRSKTSVRSFKVVIQQKLEAEIAGIAEA
jgi:hypothetical protein